MLWCDFNVDTICSSIHFILIARHLIWMGFIYVNLCPCIWRVSAVISWKIVLICGLCTKYLTAMWKHSKIGGFHLLKVIKSMTQLRECYCNITMFYDQRHTITAGRHVVQLSVGGSAIDCRREHVRVQPVEEWTLFWSLSLVRPSRIGCP
jgi:hypothetical protein